MDVQLHIPTRQSAERIRKAGHATYRALKGTRNSKSAELANVTVSQDGSFNMRVYSIYA